MTGWFAALAAALIAALLLLMPMRLDARYDGDGFSVAGYVGPLPFHLYPRAKGKRNGRSRGHGGRTGPQKVISGLLLENGGRTLCRIIEGMRVELLRIHYTAAGPDPYDAVMAYGQMGELMEAFRHLAGDRIEQTDFHTDVDFNGDRPVLDGRIRLQAALGHILIAAFGFGTGLLRGYSEYRRTAKTEGCSIWQIKRSVN